jgi:hypothetical protein
MLKQLLKNTKQKEALKREMDEYRAAKDAIAEKKAKAKELIMKLK